jgi:hypothetical protein
VFNFLQGQYATFTTESFAKALTLYPLSDYGNSLVTQGAQMYGEVRYICPALLITGNAKKANLTAYHYR